MRLCPRAMVSVPVTAEGTRGVDPLIGTEDTFVCMDTAATIIVRRTNLQLFVDTITLLEHARVDTPAVVADEHIPRGDMLRTQPAGRPPGLDVVHSKIWEDQFGNVNGTSITSTTTSGARHVDTRIDTLGNAAEQLRVDVEALAVYTALPWLSPSASRSQTTVNSRGSRRRL